jgi:hypothetical protein
MDALKKDNAGQMGFLRTSLTSAMAQEVARLDTDIFKLAKESDM